MRKNFVYCVAIAGCAAMAMAGCSAEERTNGAKTFIIEMDGTAYVTEEETSEEISSEVESEPEESSSEAETSQIEYIYSNISSNEDIVKLVVADMFDDLDVNYLDITDVRAARDGKAVIPEETISFNVEVEDGADVILYRLDSKGELESEALVAEDGTVSFGSDGCGHWIIVNTDINAKEESSSEEVTTGEESSVAEEFSSTAAE